MQMPVIFSRLPQLIVFCSLTTDQNCRISNAFSKLAASNL
jgi:hypothetical protein